MMMMMMITWLKAGGWRQNKAVKLSCPTQHGKILLTPGEKLPTYRQNTNYTGFCNKNKTNARLRSFTSQ